ncbi:PKD domain-containing protein [Marinomonas sp. PE14-40]|uniref:PKD domain-containing protein n=1 Tax=Marinomonas sp. PE14-40 TaxID=3060621 RepID=UPI003F67A930
MKKTLSLRSLNAYQESGDGTNSNLVNPVHTYVVAGDYKVTLTVNDSTGDQDNFERSLTISAE